MVSSTFFEAGREGELGERQAEGSKEMFLFLFPPLSQVGGKRGGGCRVSAGVVCGAMGVR